MNMIKPRKPVQAQPLQDEVPIGNPQADGESEIGAPGVNALLQQIAGSTFKEFGRLIAELQDVSEKTVRRDWITARLWLYNRMKPH